LRTACDGADMSGPSWLAGCFAVLKIAMAVTMGYMLVTMP